MGAIDPFTTVPATILALDDEKPNSCCDESTRTIITIALLAAAIFTACFFTGVALPITIVATVLGSIFLTAIISSLFSQAMGKEISLNPDFIARKVITIPLPEFTNKEIAGGVRKFKTLMNALFYTKGFFLPISKAALEKALSRREWEYDGSSIPNQQTLGLIDEADFRNPAQVAKMVNEALDHYINDFSAEDGTHIDSSRRQVATLMHLTAAHMEATGGLYKLLTDITKTTKTYFKDDQARFFAACANPNNIANVKAGKDVEAILSSLADKLQQFSPEMRTFATSFTGHCAHQPQIAFREYYDTKIDGKQLDASVEIMTLEQQMLAAFQKDRSQFFIGIIRENLDCGVHRSNNEVYYNRIFQQELNLGGLPLDPSELDRHARPGLEEDLRTAFKLKYTSQYILERAGELIGQGIPSDMVGKWFTEKYPHIPQDKFMNGEATHYRHSALYILLREHKILNDPA